MPESFVSPSRGEVTPVQWGCCRSGDGGSGFPGSSPIHKDGVAAAVARCGHSPVARAGRVPFHPRQHLRLRVAGWEPAGREMPARCDPSSAARSRRLQSLVTFQMQQLPHRAGRLPAGEEAGTVRGKETTRSWSPGWMGPTPCPSTWGQGDAAWWDSPLLAGFYAFGVCSWHSWAGLELSPGLWSAEAAEVGGVLLWPLAEPCPCGTGFCRGLDGARALPHGAGSSGARGTTLPRMSSSINTSKRVLMAASKQEGTETQTRLLATGRGEKQLSLQAREALLPAQL